jgi:hypothetical protein
MHASWGSRLTTTKGKALYQAICNTSSHTISSGKPTYWPSDPAKQPDCIDFFISHGINPNYTDITNLRDLSSDHSPLILTLSDTILCGVDRAHLTNRKTNWDTYRKELHNLIDLRVRLKSPNNIDAALTNLQDAITAAATLATPQTTTTKPITTFFPAVIRQSIRDRRKARHRWQCTRDPVLKSVFNDCCKRTKELIREFRE